MSSIKKYLQGDVKDWVKFAETNAFSDELSNANNISVDFGAHQSVNAVLQSHNDDIEKLKRNVAWLALHGGGGSGSGSGGGSSTRKATCTIYANNQTGNFAITSGQAITVELRNCKPATNSDPWNITITIDGTTVSSVTKTPINQNITIPLEWDVIGSFFEGDLATKNHKLYVAAIYNGITTGLEGSAQFESYVYIPQVKCSFTIADSYDIDSSSIANATIYLNTALTGDFEIVATTTTYDHKFTDVLVASFNKTTDSKEYNFNIAKAVTDASETINLGVYQTSLTLRYINGTETQNLYSDQKQVIFYRSSSSASLINLTGISTDPTVHTEIYDNINALSFAFYAFKGSAKKFYYDVKLVEETEVSPTTINVITGATGNYGVTIDINTIISDSDFVEGKSYKMHLIITPDGETVASTFYGYVTCVKGTYQFISYQPGESGGESNRLFVIDPFNSLFNNNVGLSPDAEVVSKTSDSYNLDKEVRSYLKFKSINSRSGLATESVSGMKSIALYETYMDIENKFTYYIEDSGRKLKTDSLDKHTQFTIGICYKTQKYYSNDHIIFALCNNGNINDGICIKTDGIYIKGNRSVIQDSNKVNSIHIVYNTGTQDSSVWSSSLGTLKIYINGVITYVTGSCPFASNAAGKMTNENLKIQVNGIQTSTSDRQQTCNCDIYSIEILKTALNELDILASYVNNKVRTTYVSQAPDFNVIKKILNKNCCSYNNESYTIASQIYTQINQNWKYDFGNVFLDNNEVPSDETKKEKYCSNLSSMSIPIVYIDSRDSTKSEQEQDDGTWDTIDCDWWKFDEFIKTDMSNIKKRISSKFHYWDPSKNMMPISADSVNVQIQGTSTTMDKIKNLQIDFEQREEGTEIVQDLLFVRSDWIPENSYVLKADVVDSSHANNASIGKFINDNFEYGNSFEFGFDDNGIAEANILSSTAALKVNQNWSIDPSLKHTVEGFQVMLMVRFFEEESWRNLGIYSFNISRKAARNLGFENIVSINDAAGVAVTNQIAPSVLKSVKVNTRYDDSSNVFWVENSESKNFDAISAWTTDTISLSVDTTRETTPKDGCRFWHKKVTKIGDQDVEDYKLNYEFEVKYNNTTTSKTPSQITQFVNFVKEISELPVEGLSKSAARSVSNKQVTGKYITGLCDQAGTYTPITTQYHELKNEINDQMVTTFKPDHFMKYYMIALMFGLIDNLDKNISYRLFGNSKVLADFYDMDTALGLDNTGLNDVTPTVGPKMLLNYTNSEAQDFPEETFNSTKMKSIYPSTQPYPSNYTKYLPEVYSNKIWMSLDTIAMRDFQLVGYSLYANTWFKLREYIDAIVNEDGNYDNFVDYFIGEYFEAQSKAGTMMYNYDYMMKYLNDFDQEGIKKEDNQMSKLHGLRIDEARQWLKEHIDFLDSYFYWKNGSSYIAGDTKKPENLNSVVSKTLKITMNSSSSGADITTSYPVLMHSKSSANGNQVGDTLIPYNNSARILVPGGGTGKPMLLNCSPLLKNIDLVSLGITIFRSTDDKIKFLDSLILDNLTIADSGISLNDFVDPTSTEINNLSKISMNGTTFASMFELDLNKYQLLNVNYVDIGKSTNITKLYFYETTSSDKTTQILKYLNVNESDIEELKLKNQSQINIPTIDKCNHLTSIVIENCNLDNVDSATKAKSPITLSAHPMINNIELQNVESISAITLHNCENLKDVTIDGISALTQISIKNDTQLTSLAIKNCPVLTSIVVTDCKSLPKIEVLNNPSLQNLDLNYDTAISTLNICEDSVKNIRTINIRNVNISGFNFYDSGTGTYKAIDTDPKGNILLDFAKFENLNSNGITIKRNYSGDYTEDRCANFRAIRLPNTPKRAYSIVDRSDDGIGARFTKLKNLYGHVQLTSQSFGYKNGYPANGLFLNDGDQYKGYPQFIYKLTSSPDSDLARNTIFDLMESKLTDIGAKLKNRSDLEQLEDPDDPNIVNDFIQSEADDFSEFDSREWATNYSVNSLQELFQRILLDPFTWQYLIYRYAIASRKNQIIGKASDFAEFATVNDKIIPANTFRFIGKTFRKLSFLIGGSPTGVEITPYQLSSDLMQWMPNLTCYNYFSTCDQLSSDAFTNNTLITQLGDDSAYNIPFYSSSTMKIVDSEKKFFESLPNLQTITYFNPTNNSTNEFSISSYALPSGVTTINKSFTKEFETCVIDLKSVIANATSLVTIKDSFGKAKLVLKPTTFSNTNALTSIDLSEYTKYIVKDGVTIEQLWSSYKEEGTFKGFFIEEDYDQLDFDEFLTTLLKKETRLQTVKYLLANSEIPYRNIINQEGSLKLHRDTFAYNTILRDISYLLQNAKYQYGLVGEMFRNDNASLQTVQYAFANNNYSYGISSEIPYHLLYQGNSTTSKTFIGTDRFQDLAKVMSYGDLTSTMRRMYMPTSQEAGAKSAEFNVISSFLSTGGFMDLEAYSSIESDLTGQHVILTSLTDIEAQKDYCPLVSVDTETLEEVITPGGEKLYNTLSTIAELFKDNSYWKTTFCGVASKAFNISSYYSNIVNVEGLFAGNCNIKPYSGEIKTENNESYNPFYWNYNDTAKSLTFNEERNTFEHDDSWSQNGKIWKELEDGTVVIDTENFITSHYNVSDESMKLISANYDTVTELTDIDGNKKAVNGDVIKNGTYMNGNEAYTWFEYYMSPSKIREFRYICAPDTFRYCSQDAVTSFVKVFSKCDVFANITLSHYAASNPYTLKYSPEYMNIGLTGRIPPNLFKNLPNLETISNAFAGCYHMTGYAKQQTDGKYRTYLVPELLFQYAPKVYNLTYAFSGTLLNYNPDLATPLKYITAGAIANQIGLNINGIFAKSVWYNCDLIVANVFAGRYFSNIDHSFACYGGTGVASRYYPIVSYGTKINLIPLFSIFTASKYIKQSQITWTYRGMSTSNDWAWQTTSNDGAVTPSEQPK